MCDAKRQSSSHSPWENWVLDKEPAIREALKAIYCKHTFAVSGLARINQRYGKQQLVDIPDRVRSSGKFGNAIPETSDDHCSAACVFSQMASRISVLTNVLPTLRMAKKGGLPLHLVTIADAKDQCRLGELAKFSQETALRRFDRSVAALRKLHPDVIIFATMEVSVSTLKEVVSFEPHIHAIIAGPTKAEISAACKSNVTNNQKKNSKPLMNSP